MGLPRKFLGRERWGVTHTRGPKAPAKIPGLREQNSWRASASWMKGGDSHLSIWEYAQHCLKCFTCCVCRKAGKPWDTHQGKLFMVYRWEEALVTGTVPATSHTIVSIFPQQTCVRFLRRYFHRILQMRNWDSGRWSSLSEKREHVWQASQSVSPDEAKTRAQGQTGGGPGIGGIALGWSGKVDSRVLCTREMLSRRFPRVCWRVATAFEVGTLHSPPNRSHLA